MLRKGQEGHVRAERDVLKAASLVPSSSIHEWIIKLHYSFQDRENLYLVSISSSFRVTVTEYIGNISITRFWNTWVEAIS
jgi:hypothetical protein